MRSVVKVASAVISPWHVRAATHAVRLETGVKVCPRSHTWQWRSDDTVAAISTNELGKHSLMPRQDGWLGFGW